VQLSRVLNANCQIYVEELPQRRDSEDPDAADPVDSPAEDDHQ